MAFHRLFSIQIKSVTEDWHSLIALIFPALRETMSLSPSVFVYIISTVGPHYKLLKGSTLALIWPRFFRSVQRKGMRPVVSGQGIL